MSEVRLVRFRLQDETGFGAVLGQEVHRLQGEPWINRQLGEAIASVGDVELLAPCRPGKIVAVGLNYSAHADESNHLVPDEPLLFLKPSTSVIGPGEDIVYPSHLSQRVGHEAELAVVMGRRAKRVCAEEATNFVLGYTCANDVTARDLQAKDGQWTRSKAFDTFCPLGPWIVTDLDPGSLSVRSSVNGKVRQNGHTSDMIFPIAEIVAFASAVMTLEPGDVLLTGTPSGVGLLVPGDHVTVEIEGIGALSNRVVDQRDRA